MSVELRCRLAGALCLAALLLGGCATQGTEVRQSPEMPPLTTPAPERAPPLPPALPPPRPAETPATVTPLPTPLALTRGTIEPYIPARAKDRAGWADDIARAFAALGIQPTADNICSVVAITEQESLFVADPPVPGLSKIVWKEIEQRRLRYGIPTLVLEAALAARSPDGRTYRQRIDGLRTEKQMNTLYGDMISELPFGPLLLAEHNPVRTGGPMQVNIEFAERHARSHRYPYPVATSIRDEVFSRRGGIYFGTAILLDYEAPYKDPVFRFADFNAGRFSSRNAAFQVALSIASGQALVPDGDLLRYQDGRPSRTVSQTQMALHRIAPRLAMSAEHIARELQLEKGPRFSQTTLYERVFALAERARGAPLARAVIPRIELKSPKITRKLTTEWFAKRVKWRFRNCLSGGQR